MLNRSSIADILSGSWRKSPPPADSLPALSSKDSRILLKTGAAGLAWRRLRATVNTAGPELVRLHNAYRLKVLDAAVLERHTVRAFTYLQSKGIDPILVKGWAIARHYPEAGLRPYGDIDLIVRPQDYARTKSALQQPAALGLPIDLQQGCPDLERDRTLERIYARCKQVRLMNAEIRVLCPEDHLRLLCLHMLRHGAFRPLWLCDIALTMESLPQNFDWDYFLSGNKRRTDWVSCALGMAHAVLGAELGDWPVAARARNLPRWLIPALLKQWSAGEYYIIDTSPLKTYLFKPTEALRAIRLRWPNPIHATVELGTAFNGLPRFPYQVADSFRRAALFALSLAGVGSGS